MQRFLYTLIICCGLWALAGAQDITVPQTQRPLITKRTASWCPNCGGWGWTFFRNILDDNKDKAVFFADHYDGIHTTPTSLAIAANFGGVSQPLFFFNNQNQNVSSGATAAARAGFLSQVNAAYATAPAVQSGIRAILNAPAQMLSVQTKVRFFQSLSGEYYQGIYLVRKEMIGFQSGQGNNAEHKEVLWGHLTPTVFGELLGNGPIAAGTDILLNGQISVAGLNAAQLRVVTVIWRKEGDTYRVVNANEEDTFLEPSNTDELARENSLTIFPNIIADQARVELEIASAGEMVRLELVSSTGQYLETLYSGMLPAGKHQFTLSKNTHPAGVYYLRLAAGTGQRTERVIFR